MEHPELNDLFAQSVGQKTLVDLSSLIRKNLLEHAQEEERMRLEREMLEAIANASRFEDLPDLLLNEEINRMIHELEHRIQEEGLDFNTYLKTIGKTLSQLKLDLSPQAVMRVKVSLVLREIAKQEKIEIEQKEIDQEIDLLAAPVDQKELRDQIYSPEYREYMHGRLKNRKVLEILKKTMVK